MLQHVGKEILDRRFRCQSSDNPKPSEKSASATLAKLGPMSAKVCPRPQSPLVRHSRMMWAGFMSGPCPKAARSEATSASGSPGGTTGTPSTGVLSIWAVALVSDSAMLKAKTSTSEMPESVAMAV